MTFTITIPGNPIIWILGLVVLVNLALAYRTWIGNPRHPVNILYALAVLMAGLWAFCWLMYYMLFDSPLLLGLLVRFSYLFAALIVFFFYFFSYYFPYKTFKLSLKSFVVLFLITGFVLVISVLPDVFLALRVFPANRFKPEISLFWHIIYAIYFIGFVLLAFRNLFIKYKQYSGGIWHKRLKQIMIASSCALIGGMIFSLIIPIIYNDKLIWLGTIFTLFTAAYIWYHIFWKSKRSIRE